MQISEMARTKHIAKYKLKGSLRLPVTFSHTIRRLVETLLCLHKKYQQSQKNELNSPRIGTFASKESFDALVREQKGSWFGRGKESS